MKLLVIGPGHPIPQTLTNSANTLHLPLPGLCCFYRWCFAFCNVSSSLISPKHLLSPLIQGSANSSWSPVSSSRVTFEWLPQFRKTSLTKTSSSMSTSGSHSFRQRPLPSRTCPGGTAATDSCRLSTSAMLRCPEPPDKSRISTVCHGLKVPKTCQSHCHTLLLLHSEPFQAPGSSSCLVSALPTAGSCLLPAICCK